MRVPAARSCDATASGRPHPPIPRCTAGPSPLTHRSRLGTDIQVDVDVLAAHRWSAAAHALPTDPDAAAPWLRSALVDALDRWLHVALDQSLVDAERGVSRARAARTLPDAEARAELVGDALRLARRASRGLVAYLRQLPQRPSPVPESLFTALTHLVDGYAELAGDVARPDRELSAVLDGWRRLPSRVGQAGRQPSARAAPSLPQEHFRTRLANMIDPRQVRARLLALSPEPSLAEVTLSEAPGDPASVLVRVPAFGQAVDPEACDRLMARLVDRRTARVKGHALATLTTGRAGEAPCFEATVPLFGLDITDVRADLFDLPSGIPPVNVDTDSGLLEARRAVVFLAEWRQLVGLAQLSSAVAAPARRLRDLTARLRAGRLWADDEAIYGGGPSMAVLEALAALDDEHLLRKLRNTEGSDPFAITRGTAGLLVAELAAAHAAPAH